MSGPNPFDIPGASSGRSAVPDLSTPLGGHSTLEGKYARGRELFLGGLAERGLSSNPATAQQIAQALLYCLIRKAASRLGDVELSGNDGVSIIGAGVNQSWTEQVALCTPRPGELIGRSFPEFLSSKFFSGIYFRLEYVDYNGSVQARASLNLCMDVRDYRDNLLRSAESGTPLILRWCFDRELRRGERLLIAPSTWDSNFGAAEITTLDGRREYLVWTYSPESGEVQPLYRIAPSFRSSQALGPLDKLNKPGEESTTLSDLERLMGNESRVALDLHAPEVQADLNELTTLITDELKEIYGSRYIGEQLKVELQSCFVSNDGDGLTVVFGLIDQQHWYFLPSFDGQVPTPSETFVGYVAHLDRGQNNELRLVKLVRDAYNFVASKGWVPGLCIPPPEPSIGLDVSYFVLSEEVFQSHLDMLIKGDVRSIFHSPLQDQIDQYHAMAGIGSAPKIESLHIDVEVGVGADSGSRVIVARANEGRYLFAVIRAPQIGLIAVKRPVKLIAYFPGF